MARLSLSLAIPPWVGAVSRPTGDDFDKLLLGKKQPAELAWVAGWLHTELLYLYPPEDGHPSQY